MSRSDRGDRRRQRVEFCVAKRRRGCKLCGSQFSTPIKLYIVFTLSLMPRRARPFLCRRKERAERFAFKGGISIPPFELSELKSLLKVFQAWLRQLKDRFLILTEICTPTILSRLPPRSVLLSIRLEVATGNPHPPNDKGFTRDPL